eukprot:2000923-Prymnesium_polylepis.2
MARAARHEPDAVPCRSVGAAAGRPQTVNACRPCGPRRRGLHCTCSAPQYSRTVPRNVPERLSSCHVAVRAACRAGMRVEWFEVVRSGARRRVSYSADPA